MWPIGHGGFLCFVLIFFRYFRITAVIVFYAIQRVAPLRGFRCGGGAAGESSKRINYKSSARLLPRFQRLNRTRYSIIGNDGNIE